MPAPSIKWNIEKQKWSVNVTMGDNPRHLGDFDNKEDAKYAYKMARRQQYYEQRQTWKRNNRKNYHCDIEKRREYDKTRRRKELQGVVDAYGGKCQCCGETHIEFLTVDHINGGGTQHRKVLNKEGRTFYVWLREMGYPKDDFRVLCYNCNCSMGRVGYCPHQKENNK